ncbi:hypothetical protein KU617_23800, partial [Salmonella enterica subsp. enterica serovar Montevideo]|nr:hypothetical protein [Salmonella enterica subsp. enterica serovar Montevideo]
AKVIEEAKALAEHGIVFGEPKTDIDKIRTWKEKVITQLTGGLGYLIAHHPPGRSIRPYLTKLLTILKQQTDHELSLSLITS